MKQLNFLFGPNSSGKSSFLKAMMFISKNLFPLNTGRTIYKLSDDVDLGSFKDIVTNNDTSKVVSFEIELEGTYLFPKKEFLSLEDFSENGLRELNLFDELFEVSNMVEILSKLQHSSFFNVMEELINDIQLERGPQLKMLYEKILEKCVINSTFTIEFKNIENSTNLSKIIIKDNIKHSDIGKNYNYANLGHTNTLIPTEENEDYIYLLNDSLITSLLSGFFEFPFDSKFEYPKNFPNLNQFLNDLIDYSQNTTLRYFTIPPYEEWEKYDSLEKKNIYYELLKFIYISYRLIPNNLFRFFLIKHLPLTRINPRAKYIMENNEFSDDDYYALLNLVNEEQNKIFKDKEELKDLSEKENLLEYFQIKTKKESENNKDGYNKNIYLLSNFYLQLFFNSFYYLKCNEEVGRIFILNNIGSIFNFSTASSGLIQLFPVILYLNILNKNNFMQLNIAKNELKVGDQYWFDRFYIYSDNIDVNDLVITYGDFSFDNLGKKVCNKCFAQLYIEQPELHLHPKLQSQLAELFTDTIQDSNKESIITIETHSEHLIRKMQVQIAKGELSKDKVGVWYFDNSGGTTKIKEMKIDENGLFKEDWPRGFFDDSINLTMELFEALRKRKN